MRRILRKVAAGGKAVTVEVRREGGKEGGRKGMNRIFKLSVLQSRNPKRTVQLTISLPSSFPPSLLQELGDTSTLAEADVIKELIANHV